MANVKGAIFAEGEAGGEKRAAEGDVARHEEAFVAAVDCQRMKASGC
jgi:hypothetical protein